MGWEMIDYDASISGQGGDPKSFAYPISGYPEDQEPDTPKEQSMSIESAKAFVERMKTDGEFRKRIAEAESPEVRAYPR